MLKKTVIVFILFFVSLFVLPAHPGRTDKNGGHNGPNGYHYHNGGGGGSGRSNGGGGSTAATAEKFIILNKDHGGLYHKTICDLVKGKESWQATKNKAKELGYKPCNICNP
jgi:hypothetical protein